MNRRGFLAAMFCAHASVAPAESGHCLDMRSGIVSPGSCSSGPKLQKFYVTTPGTTLTGCQPVFVYAKDRLSADMELRLTVWTEEEWASTKDFPPPTDHDGKRLFFDPIDYWKSGSCRESITRELK